MVEIRGLSSVGRASGLHPECRRIVPFSPHMIEEFAQELTDLCNKYGYVISGKTVTGSLIVRKVESEVECKIEKENENNSFLRCSCKI